MRRVCEVVLGIAREREYTWNFAIPERIPLEDHAAPETPDNSKKAIFLCFLSFFITLLINFLRKRARVKTRYLTLLMLLFFLSR